MSIRVSVVTCTLNRAGYLRKALQSLADQTLPQEQYEVLVVDNGSRDETKQVVREECGHLGNLRYIYEPIMGLNQARNAGCRSAQGKYVAYLDDDAVACREWLERILDVFETARPEAGCVGGKIEPIWQGERPAWLSDNIAVYLAVLDWPEPVIVSRERHLLIGTNMAFPRHLLELIGGFHPSLDRRGRRLLSNGDVMVQYQIMKRGYPCVYHSDISVRHHIQSSRLTKAFFARRMYWQGVSDALMDIHLQSLTFRKRGEMAIRRVRQVLRSRRSLRTLFGRADDCLSFQEKCDAWAEIGYATGLLGLAR